MKIYYWDDEKIQMLADSLHSLHERVCSCRICGNLTDCSAGETVCAVCSASNRDNSKICVVENAVQLQSIESCGAYKGLYHILGGHLSPLNGKGQDSIRIDSLFNRIKSGNIEEIILALSPDIEGQATSVYISNLVKGHVKKITRLSQGLPPGANLSYIDNATMTIALNSRIDFI